MELPLIRKEAADYMQRRLLGSVVVQRPAGITQISYLLACSMVVSLGLLTTMKYSRTAAVPAWIIPSQGLTRVSAQYDGLLTDLDVRQGESVRVGTILADVRRGADSSGDDVDASLLKVLDREKAESASVDDEAIASLKAKLGQLVNARAAAVAAQTLLAGKLSLATEKTRIAADTYSRGAKLAEKGYMSQNALNTQKLTSIDTEDAVTDIQQRISDSRSSVKSLDEEISGTLADIKGLEAKARVNQAEMEQRLETTKRQAGFQVKAPMTGTILAIPEQPGEQVAAGTTIAIMSPTRPRLELEFFAPAKLSEALHVGATIRVRYASRPYESYRLDTARIYRVSGTLELPKELNNTAYTLKEPVYVCRARFTSTRMARWLKPGMLATANIVVETHSLLWWFFSHEGS